MLYEPEPNSTGRDKAAATAALVMARTSTNVPAASAVTGRVVQEAQDFGVQINHVARLP